MEMLLTKGSEVAVMNEILSDPSWLTDERISYIIKKRPGILSVLKPEDINQEILNNSLKDTKILLELADNLKNAPAWHKTIAKSIPRPLTKLIFKENGVLLNFLDKEEYEPVIKDWVTSSKTSDDIPREFHKYFTEKQVITRLEKHGYLDFDSLPEEVKTTPVYLSLMKNSRDWEKTELYKKLPQDLKDNEDIAYMVCYNNKQFYKQLSQKAKFHERVISRVIDNVLPSYCDTVPDDVDPKAIKAKELPLEVVRAINDKYLMKKIFKNSNFHTDTEIQKKWFTKDENKEDFPEYLKYFPKKTDDELRQELRAKPTYIQIRLINANPELANIVLDKNNVSECLLFLFNFHNNNFETAIKKLNLKQIVENNLDELINIYTSYPHKDHIWEEKSLKFGKWLLKKNTPEDKFAACKLLSSVVERNPNIFQMSLDYLYGIEDHTLQDNANAVYKYMDANKIKPKKKKM
jgi:hypothetical protein